mgnify:CR=1 FL=1
MDSDVTGATQSRQGPFRPLDHGLEIGEVQEVGAVEVDVRAGREIKHARGLVGLSVYVVMSAPVTAADSSVVGVQCLQSIG